VLTTVHILISLMPVVFFLAGLVLIDSYKLVRPKAVMFALLAGLLAAVASYYLNGWLRPASGLSVEGYSRYLAPLTEEGLKAIWLGYIVFSDRVGFAVDSAILGFAVGAGFAVFENLYFLSALDLGTQTWVIRGFGTAIMHGVTTTVFAVILKTLQREGSRSKIQAVIGAFILAAILHSIYNHFPFEPMLMTAFLVVTSPLILSMVFTQSERATRGWLGNGFDTDQELMKLLMSGDFSNSHTGQFLSSLKEHFDGTVVADMFCLLRIRVELSIRAKGQMMMAEAGFESKPDEQVHAKFQELKYLEKSIGKTGLLAIQPVQKWSSKELWQLNMLSEQ